jgi:hypothetical protein
MMNGSRTSELPEMVLKNFRSPSDFIKKLEKKCAVNPNSCGLLMSVHLILQIGSFYLSDFFSLCGVPVAGDSHWSSKRRYAAATYLQIFQPIGNNRRLFL